MSEVDTTECVCWMTTPETKHLSAQCQWQSLGKRSERLYEGGNPPWRARTQHLSHD